MNELIKITERDGQKAVSAHDLYNFICENQSESFGRWWARNSEYGFMESVDYQRVTFFTPHNNQEITDYALTIDCAKEISMLQRNEKGKQARQYFIACEKKLKKVTALLPDFNNPAEAARAWAEQYEQKQLAESKAKELQEKAEAQQKRIAVLEPKAEFMDRVMDTDQKIDIGQAAKILALPFGRNTLFVKLREKGIFFKNRNEPKQEYIERGYFELKEKWIDREHHDGFMVVKVLVTQRGLDFIAKLFEAAQNKKSVMKLA